jgi:hypothetical protein
MFRAHRRLGFVMVAAGTLVPAAAVVAASPGSFPPPPPGLGVKLLQGPDDRLDDPRAHIYIIDHLAPGTTISRQIGYSNGNTDPMDVTFFAVSADLDGGGFIVGADHTPNELTSWTSFSVDHATIQPGETLPVIVTIAVPANATRGERYAAALAATVPSSSTGGGVSTISRVGIRIYLSVGTGGEPITAFTIGTMTASRNAAGHPVVTADIHNTGERAVDLSGSLQLANGPGSLTAGPFVAKTTATLAPGASGHVEIVLDDQVPNGPWDAAITLKSGITTEIGTATITFPSAAGQAEPVAAIITTDNGRSLALPASAGAAALVLVGATFALAQRRRRHRLGRP